MKRTALVITVFLLGTATGLFSAWVCSYRESPPAAEQQPLPPVFAWGAGLLSLLLLFLFWFRNRSDAPLRNEAAGKEFVDMVFDEK